jgi:large subunit ribosomal protein L4
MPKKVRALALRHALSAKARDGGIIVWDGASIDAPKTKGLLSSFEKLGFRSVLIIDGAQVQENFALAASNIPNIDVLPVQGINVYDIIRREKLVLTRAAVDALEARFK